MLAVGYPEQSVVFLLVVLAILGGKVWRMMTIPVGNIIGLFVSAWIVGSFWWSVWMALTRKTAADLELEEFLNDIGVTEQEFRERNNRA